MDRRGGGRRAERYPSYQSPTKASLARVQQQSPGRGSLRRKLFGDDTSVGAKRTQQQQQQQELEDEPMLPEIPILPRQESAEEGDLGHSPAPSRRLNFAEIEAADDESTMHQEELDGNASDLAAYEEKKRLMGLLRQIKQDIVVLERSIHDAKKARRDSRVDQAGLELQRIVSTLLEANDRFISLPKTATLTETLTPAIPSAKPKHLAHPKPYLQFFTPIEFYHTEHQILPNTGTRHYDLKGSVLNQHIYFSVMFDVDQSTYKVTGLNAKVSPFARYELDSFLTR